MNEESTSFIQKIKQNQVVKTISAYAVLAFVTVQVASLVKDSFGLNQEFMQTLIWIFLIGFPVLVFFTWAYSSKFSTFKILGNFVLVLILGYGSGSYVWVKNFALPDLKKELEKDNYVAAWDQLNLLNSFY